MSKLLIVFIGDIGGGKSTATDILVKYGFKNLAFADPLKQFALSIGFTYKQIYGNQSDKQEINKIWNISGREFLQKFGTEICRNILPKTIPTMNLQNQSLWVGAMEQQIQQNDYVVISDCRFPDEAALCQKYNSILIRLKRSKCPTTISGQSNKSNTSNTSNQSNQSNQSNISNQSKSPTYNEQAHLSEQFHKKIKANYTIINNGSIKDLENTILAIIKKSANITSWPIQSSDEILFNKKYNRLTVSPIMFSDIWKFYKTHEATMWHASEVKLDKDLNDWNNKLSADDRFFLKRVLAFFASSDMIVNENLEKNFIQEVQITEAKIYYGFQAMMENIHSEVYSNMIDAYISDMKEKDELFNAVNTLPCVHKKAEWANKWITCKNPFCERLVAFSIVEGIFFSGSFCAIYWIKERQLMPGLAKSNDFIARDEGIHVDFACLLYTKYIKNKMSQDRFKEILSEAVQIELEFITESIPCNLIGMNSKLMSKYIKFCANRLATQLEHTPIYMDAEQPFAFMDQICLSNKSNFFEHEPSEYKTFTEIESSQDAYNDL